MRIPKSGRLTVVRVSSLKEPGLYADGGGLYLQIMGRSKSWIFRFSMNKRARAMGLGPVDLVSLAEARLKALSYRRQLLDGIDPLENRREKQRADRTEAEITLRFCAGKYIEAHRLGWRNEKHAEQWSSTFERYVFPSLGNTSVGKITTSNVMDVLRPLWETRTETASRVRGRLEAVLSWATVHGYRSGENPARWRGHLDNLLPKRSKVQKVKHHPALAYNDTPAFFREIRDFDSVAARALEFLILTGSRTGEVVAAKWSEFDLANKIWTISAERMKAGREHRVPLSPQVLKLLKALGEMQRELPSYKGVYVFQNARNDKHLSNMAMLVLLGRMGRSEITVHGFRSTFKDWSSEQTTYSREVSEMALAHTIGDKVEAAYRRGDLFNKRYDLMCDWADFVTGKKSGENSGYKNAEKSNVIDFRRLR